MNGTGSGQLVLQSLLHDSLLATGHVESCALFRKKDGTVKASSAGYEVIMYSNKLGRRKRFYSLCKFMYVFVGHK